MAAAKSNARRGSTALSRRHACGTVSAVFFKAEAQPYEEVVRQHHEGLMVMPPAPRARLVMVHAKFTLAFLKGPFDWPALSAHPDQGIPANRSRSVAEIVFGLRPRTQRPAQH